MTSLSRIIVTSTMKQLGDLRRGLLRGNKVRPYNARSSISF